MEGIRSVEEGDGVEDVLENEGVGCECWSAIE